MIYKNISIKNFRGIRDCSLDNMVRVNLFLGQNNCGKSSLLEAIFLLTGLNSPQLIISIDLLRNLAHTEESDFRFIFYNLTYTNSPEISAELVESGSSSNLTITPKNASNRTTPSKTISSTTISNVSASTDSRGTEAIDGLQMHGEIKKRHAAKTSVKSSITFKREANGLFSFSTEVDKNYKTDFVSVLQSSNHRYGPETTKRIEELIIEKQKSSMINPLKTIDSKIEDITLGANGMVYFDIGAERFIPSNLMGDGVIKYMNIIANLNTVKGGVLLIDEIDNGLHYSSLKKIWKIILTTAKSYDVQLFITTHSKEALVYLKEILEENEMQDYRSDVKCYTISKLNDDKVYSYEYDFAAFDFALQNDLEIRGEI